MLHFNLLHKKNTIFFAIPASNERVSAIFFIINETLLVYVGNGERGTKKVCEGKEPSEARGSKAREARERAEGCEQDGRKE